MPLILLFAFFLQNKTAMSQAQNVQPLVPNFLT